MTFSDRIRDLADVLTRRGGTPAALGPVVQDSRGVYFVIVAGDEGRNARCDVSDSIADMARDALRAELIGRGIEVQDFDCELELARWCAERWPSARRLADRIEKAMA